MSEAQKAGPSAAAAPTPSAAGAARRFSFDTKVCSTAQAQGMAQGSIACHSMAQSIAEHGVMLDGCVTVVLIGFGLLVGC